MKLFWKWTISRKKTTKVGTLTLTELIPLPALRTKCNPSSILTITLNLILVFPNPQPCADDEQRQELDSKAKKAVEKLRNELKLLLDQPLTQKQGAGVIGRKNAFVVVAK